MSKYLFIGGSKDGERLEVKELTKFYDVPALLSCDQSFKPVFRTERYRMERFGCQHANDVRRFTLYIHETLTTADAMIMLMDGYKTKSNG